MTAACALSDRIRQRALALGFDAVGIAPARLAPHSGRELAQFLAKGWYGDMKWLADNGAVRGSPERLWPAARSAIVVAMNYGPDGDPMARLAKRRTGVISVYALNRDYHDIIKGRLKTLAGWLAARADCQVKVFVDTAPVMEKPLAAQAGIGWQGKHTNLVSRQFGSWLFLGVILTTCELPAQRAHEDRCGSCRRCLDVCPTGALPAAYRIDARRCISYLTIEHKGHIARQFRRPMGNRIYGCDDCLAVCPWNRFATVASEAKLVAREELAAPDLGDLARLDDAAFRKLFAASPVKRTGRDRFVRNVMIAIGNSGEKAYVATLEKALGDTSALVRAMAVWALGELAEADHVKSLHARHGEGESDPAVQAEWRAVMT